MQFPPNSPFTSPPSQEHLQQIAAARVLGKKVRRATGVAVFSGWTIAIFAAITIFSGIVSLSALALGIGMAIVAYYELRGAGEFKRLDRSAPRRLAINQIAFMLMLIAYAGYELAANLRSPMDLGQIANVDPKMAQTIQDMARPITIAVYLGIMLAALLGPGLTAVYYYTRRKYIEAYLNQTPTWILELQRAGMSI
ncbi:MAG TPA: hypothetical protein VKK61_00920 [Tepidisphaeraceae bacterium]|nr:hypothetical protein [Tepidisphaeraceae bacterium]